MRLMPLLFVLVSLQIIAQDNGIKFTQPITSDFQLITYTQDTTAVAVVLSEFGEAYFSQDNGNLVFEHHIKLKILKKEGVKYGDFEIPLYKGSGNNIEKLKSLVAYTYNFENNRINEDKLSESAIFTENTTKRWDVVKFTMPNVQVGSVLKISYTVESPFIYNFRDWEFQADIPKVVSEFWAKIPGNYVYNITLKGFQKLVKNENYIVNNCIQGGSGYQSYGADCVQYKFAMKNIPSLIEEDYMTAASNFLSALHFELSEVKHFDGRVERYTKTWKDAESELRKEARFGGQLRKGKDIGKKLDELIIGITDPKEKAQKIFSWFQQSYTWNEVYGILTDLGVKKAFEAGRGNVADINISLIAALDYAGLTVEPVLLSTRDNGLVTELHPVLSEFNYVVAKINFEDKYFLLDATNPHIPFGILPERCLNGKGRVFGEKESYWIDLKPTEKYKRVTILNLELKPSGEFTGTIEHSHYGYRAVEVRSKIKSHGGLEGYIKEINNKWQGVTILDSQIKGWETNETQLTEKFTVEIEGFDDLNPDNLIFNPYFSDKLERNPFRSKTRLYPVDFGAPYETSIILNLTYPETFLLANRPAHSAFTLPANGGKFLFDVAEFENKIIMNHSLSFNKTIYTSVEYPALKELFERVLQVQNIDFILKKK